MASWRSAVPEFATSESAVPARERSEDVQGEVTNYFDDRKDWVFGVWQHITEQVLNIYHRPIRAIGMEANRKAGGSREAQLGRDRWQARADVVQ